MTNSDLQRHFDAAIDRHIEHFDKKFADLEAKVDPMYAYFTTAKTNLAIMKWIVGVVAGALAAWQALKGWMR